LEINGKANIENHQNLENEMSNLRKLLADCLKYISNSKTNIIEKIS